MVDNIDIISKYCLDCEEEKINEEAKSIPLLYKN